MIDAARWKARAPALAAGAAVVALIAWTAWRRWYFLSSSPYPFGVDGYFYPIQLRSLLEEGSLYYPASPLVLWWMLPFAWLAGPIAGAKLGAAVGTALVAAPVYLLGHRVSGQRSLGLLAAALAATSAESFYHAIEFVKQGVGLTLAAVYLCALLWALDPPRPRRRWAVVALALVAAALAHKTAAVLALVASVPPVVAVAWARGRRPRWRERGTRLALAIAAGLTMVAAALGLLAPDAFIGGGDVAQVGDLFSAEARWTLPVLDYGRYPLYFGHEVAVAGVLSALALVLLFLGRGDRVRGAVIVGPALLAVLAALPWIDVGDPQGLGFRLRLMAFLPMAVAAASVGAVLMQRLPGLMRTMLAVGFVAGWVASRPVTSSEGLVDVDPDMRAAILAAGGLVPADHVIICPSRSLMFMIAYETRAYVRLRPEPVPPARRWRLMPSKFLHPQVIRALALIREQRPDGVPLPRGLHPRDENGVVLMPEVTWEWLMKQVSPDLRDRYQAWVTL